MNNPLEKWNSLHNLFAVWESDAESHLIKYKIMLLLKRFKNVQCIVPQKDCAVSRVEVGFTVFHKFFFRNHPSTT